MIKWTAKLLTFLLRRAINDPKKRAAVIKQAQAIIKDVSDLLYEVQPLR